MADAPLPSFQGFSDPLDLVDRTDMPYEKRLAILQDWQAEVSDADDQHKAALLGAIQALEMGAAVQNDEPEGAPEDHGYAARRQR